MTVPRHLRFFLCLSVITAACGGDTDIVLVPAFRADEAPGEAVVITILPYDQQAIRDSLATAYGIPQPVFPDLIRWFLAYEAPELADSGPTAAAWRATRDSVERLADALRGVDRRSAGYAGAYGRFRALYQRFTQRSSALNSLMRESTAEVRDLAERAGRAADSLRRWENAAFADFDSAAQLALEASGRDSLMPVATGNQPLTITLPPGTWWITARHRVEGNPFLELRWHVGAVTAGFPFRLTLDDRTAHTVWRH